MIRLAMKDDIHTITDFVYERNNNPLYYSAYAPKSKKDMYQEIDESIKHKRILIEEKDDQLCGVLLFFISPNHTVDVAGPFIKHDNINIASRLINRCIALTDYRPLNFFFEDQSTLYKHLMTNYKATFNDREFIMKCFRDSFEPHTSEVIISKAKETMKDTIIKIHQTLFKNSYLTTEMIADDRRYKHMYVFEKNNAIIGLSLMIIKESYAYIETFGLVPEYRGKRLSKPFLSTLLQHAFNNTDVAYVMLVVDDINDIAYKLYTSLGFDIEHHNISYTLNPKHP